jgi:hypothetical protein
LKAHLTPHKESCKKLFLVHGELDQSTILRDTMLEVGFRDIEIPDSGEEFTLV